MSNPARITSLFGLAGRVAIVTGGSRGIGRAIAQGYVDAGASVVVASRKKLAVDETVDELRERGGTALGVAAHVGEIDDLHRLVELTVAEFGRIDVIVNNAATALAEPIGEFTSAAWAKVFDVDTRGPVFLVQAALPHLEASPNASVINVITSGAFLAAPGVAMYAAAKAALLSLTRSMAADFAPRGIRVNALAPGPVDTDMTRATGEQGMAGMRQSNMQKRIATADEMVGPALFLASDASSFVTGQAIIADGGLVLAR
jgi:NAD(P)-dependent dehydrogenase (short-subunit alcohol dehydrogenase family)